MLISSHESKTTEREISTKSSALPELMKKVDLAISSQKDAMRRIDRCIIILNITAFMIAIGNCFFVILYTYYFYMTTGFLLVMKNCILVYSICRIRAFVKTIEYVLPNEGLMRIHFFNVFIYTVLYLI